MIFNADLHVHGKYSGATSNKMIPSMMAQEAKKKGIQLLGTGDCLHSVWLREFKRKATVIDDGTIEINGVRFVFTAEVEDKHRVHHLILFPDIAAIDEFKDSFSKHSKNMDVDGRPRINVCGRDIADIALQIDALIGPCHAFTPWTSLYAYFSSLKECYGDLANKIHFIELGLSADSDYADRIEELHSLTFLTNSDAHSPHPVRLAREFNRMEAPDVNYEGLRKAILRKGGRVLLNVGLPPQEGKYHESACIRCYKHYTLSEARKAGWRCQCGGIIKKGVKDRVEELADFEKARHPEHRPPYVHIIPLAEIIAKALKKKTPFCREVIALWNTLISRFGDEVTVLLDAKIDDIERVAGRFVACAVEDFRTGRVRIKPGGGGKYGVVEISEECMSDDEEGIIEGQSKLDRYLGW